MTALELLPTEDATSTDNDDSTVHWFCSDCYPEPGEERAFCGVSLRGQVEADEEVPTDCEVCNIIDVCPKCDW